MNRNLYVLIIVILICSYMLIFNFNKAYAMKEHFENSSDIMRDLSQSIEAPSINLNPDNIQYDQEGNIIRQYNKIDVSKKYEDILLSDDLQINYDENKEPEFEILDTIIKDKDNRFRAMQFENIEREVRPEPMKEEVNSFKQNFNTNTIEIPMQERSLNMNMHKHQYNNRIDIDDPIQDSYIPYRENNSGFGLKSIEQNNDEYIIISVFKNVLNRNPTKVELEKFSRQFDQNDIDESTLRINLINSVEYRRNVKLQSNEVSGDIEYEFAKKDLLFIISGLYLQELGKEIPKGMLLPLRDIWLYFQGNQFLFRAFLIDEKYPLFEKEVLELNLLTKANLSRLIDKYFILYDLKLKANDIQRYDVLSRKSKQYLEEQEKENYRKVDENDIDTTGLYKQIEDGVDKRYYNKKNEVKYMDTETILDSKEKIQDVFKSTFSSI